MRFETQLPDWFSPQTGLTFTLTKEGAERIVCLLGDGHSTRTFTVERVGLRYIGCRITEINDRGGFGQYLCHERIGAP